MNRWSHSSFPGELLIPQEAIEDARYRSGPTRVRQREQRFKGSVIARIAEAVEAGPLLLLRRCFDARARVRVVTRHARGIRGAATGDDLC